MQQPASVLLNRLLARARLRHVQVLVQLAELGSVKRTAEAVGMTQPGVTQILAELERLLETPLFHRHARGVRPTEACSDMLPLARQMLTNLADSVDAVAGRQGQGVVRVVASAAFTNGLLVRALPEFNRHHPEVQVHLKDAAHDNLLPPLSRGEADIAGGREPPVVPEGWVFRPLLDDHYVVACDAAHPLVRRRALAWADLLHEEWLPSPAGSAARRMFDALMADHPVTPRVCQVITRVPAATWWMLRGRRTLTLVPYSVVRPLVDAGELALLRLRDPLPFSPLGLLMPLQGESAAMALLADFLGRFAARTAPKERNPLVPSR